MSQLSPRTRRFANALRWACYAAILMMLTFAFYALFTPGFVVEQAAHQLFASDVTWQVGVLERAGLLLLGAVALLAVIFTLVQTAFLFETYARGEAISPAAALTIRRIGFGLLAQAAIGFFGTTLAGLLLSIGAPEGKRMLVISIGTSEIGFALAGGLMMLIGIVMLQAVEAVRENREFV